MLAPLLRVLLGLLPLRACSVLLMLTGDAIGDDILAISLALAPKLN
jgi:hypothetical protein